MPHLLNFRLKSKRSYPLIYPMTLRREKWRDGGGGRKREERERGRDEEGERKKKKRKAKLQKRSKGKQVATLML